MRCLFGLQGDVIWLHGCLLFAKCLALFAIASFVATERALAQDRAVQVTVPFDFAVGNKLLPSGTYTITSESPDVIMIQSSDKHIALLATTSYDDHESRHGGQLVFDKYGDEYFLREILCRSAAMNVGLPSSKQEKARTQEAMLHNSSQPFVAMK